MTGHILLTGLILAMLTGGLAVFFVSTHDKCDLLPGWMVKTWVGGLSLSLVIAVVGMLLYAGFNPGSYQQYVDALAGLPDSQFFVIATMGGLFLPAAVLLAFWLNLAIFALPLLGSLKRQPPPEVLARMRRSGMAGL